MEHPLHFLPVSGAVPVGGSGKLGRKRHTRTLREPGDPSPWQTPFKEGLEIWV